MVVFEDFGMKTEKILNFFCGKSFVSVNIFFKGMRFSEIDSRITTKTFITYGAILTRAVLMSCYWYDFTLVAILLN